MKFKYLLQKWEWFWHIFSCEGFWIWNYGSGLFLVLTRVIYTCARTALVLQWGHPKFPPVMHAAPLCPAPGSQGRKQEWEEKGGSWSLWPPKLLVAVAMWREPGACMLSTQGGTQPAGCRLDGPGVEQTCTGMRLQ